MKSREEIEKRIENLMIKEKCAAREVKKCDVAFLDIAITKANIIQQERQVLEWVLE